ncbi:hypothetical protein F52700_8017 [Fusarium sp. NRRL 52700]|nr:hypothetical protein F52700_8017 [Fusarium sp. NRRL 52700]
MSFITSIRHDFRKYRSPLHFSSLGARKSRMNVETFNDPGDNEMEWEMTHNPTFTSQILNRLRSELRTDWDRGLNSLINRVDAGHQKCLQATADYIEQTIRRTIEEYVIGRQDEVQSLPSHPTSSELSHSQLLLESAEPDYKTHVEDLTKTLERTQQELDDVKSQLKASESRADQLRSIIVPRNEETILDSEIQRVFSEVRTITQWVAERLFSHSGKYRESTRIDNGPFFEDIEGFSPECRQDAIHAHLSSLIRRRFFPTSVVDFDTGGKYEKLQKILVVGDREMKSALTAHYHNGNSSTEMFNWTRATFKCLDLLVDKSSGIDSYALFLEQFFKPVETDDIKSQNIGRKKLKVLCQKANELGILLRRSENIFQAFHIEKDIDFSLCEKMVEELRCNGSRTISGVKVVDCCLFGGLKKIPKEYPNEAFCLERAQVSTRIMTAKH